MGRKKKPYYPSKVNRSGGRRGCLCPDGRTYSIKCCDGSLHAQGIGDITGTLPSGVSFIVSYRIRNCEDGHEHNAYTEDRVLPVGNVYYMELSNGHTGCYEILRKNGGKGLKITNEVLYDDCADCISNN